MDDFGTALRAAAMAKGRRRTKAMAGDMWISQSRRTVAEVTTVECLLLSLSDSLWMDERDIGRDVRECWRGGPESSRN